ncbi:MAG: hypothetical protein JXA25_10115 [Anaerolineales bacterium]|nr:hypothetical protein [Anaerolineales bacterium]
MTQTEKHLPQGLQQTASYLHLLSFCPPEHIYNFKQAGGPLRQALAQRAGLKTPAYFAETVPEACQKIIEFYLAKQTPNERFAGTLTHSARLAHQSPRAAWVFSTLMALLAGSPGRSSEQNRLRKSRGCQYCAAPCRYGHFVLISHPDYSLLHQMLEENAAKPEKEQDPLQTTWRFALAHLWRSLGITQAYISSAHLGNLAYCLLVLGMANARFPFPSEELKQFQAANQLLIRHLSQKKEEAPAI